jgi:hypothetical protein
MEDGFPLGARVASGAAGRASRRRRRLGERTRRHEWRSRPWFLAAHLRADARFRRLRGVLASAARRAAGRAGASRRDRAAGPVDALPLSQALRPYRAAPRSACGPPGVPGPRVCGPRPKSAARPAPCAPTKATPREPPREHADALSVVRPRAENRSDGRGHSPAHAGARSRPPALRGLDAPPPGHAARPRAREWCWRGRRASRPHRPADAAPPDPRVEWLAACQWFGGRGSAGLAACRPPACL